MASNNVIIIQELGETKQVNQGALSEEGPQSQTLKTPALGLRRRYAQTMYQP